mgnify:FL=1
MVVQPPGTPTFGDVYGATYRLVEPGDFVLGDSNTSGHPSEQPSCTVIITEPFFLGERHVTQAQWADVMGDNPSKFQEGWSAGLRPVENVNYDDVQLFLNRLNDRDKDALYLGLYGVWRLPSEAEWEYAAKAGSNTRWWFGNKDVELDEYGWHAGNSGGTTREVGLKKPNSWGFFDMNGLVNEWCDDHWERTYVGGRTQRPHRINACDSFVVRGGSWFTESDSTRSGSRSHAYRDKRSDGLGFRLVWSPLDVQPDEAVQGVSSDSGVVS